MTGSPDAAPTPPKARRDDAPPKVGDRVRIVNEGIVTRADRGFLYVEQDNGRVLGFFLPNLNTPVEVLTPPAPTWWPPQVGDVVRYEESTYLYDEDGEVWRNGSGVTMDGPRMAELHRPHRPLRLLVRRGAVQP